MTTGKIVHSKGAKTVSVWSTGAEKRRLTVVLAATADGRMIPPMVILREEEAKEYRCTHVMDCMHSS